MYFLNLQGLKQQLKDKTHTEKDSFKYLFSLIILGMLSNSSSAKGALKGLDFTEFLIQITIVAVIALLVYLVLHSFFKKNGGEKGEHFLLRLLSLSFVVYMRTLLVTIPVLLLSLLLAKSSFTGLAIFAIIILVIGSLVYYVITVGNSLQEISGTPSPLFDAIKPIDKE